MDSSSNSVGPAPASQNSSPQAFPQPEVSERLQQGLTALAAKDEPGAIALLTAVIAGSPPPEVAERACVGLVRAHQRQGNVAQAIAYCQPLLDSPRSRTRQWGQRALTALERRSAAPKPGTGPNLPPDAPPDVPPNTSPDAPPDASLEPSPPPSDVTGFIPLEEPLQDSPTSQPAPRSAATSPTSQELPPAQSKPVEPPSAELPSTKPLSAEPSSAEPPSAKALPNRALPAKARSTDGQRRAPGTTLQLPWRQAEAAQRWRPLPAPRWFEEAVVCLWTVGSLIMLSSGLLQGAMVLGNPIRRFVNRFAYISRWRLLEDHPTLIVVLVLLLLWGLSPWVLQFLLQRWGATPLPPQQRRVGPKTTNLLKAKTHPPRLYALPCPAPLVFSYGLHSQLSWLIISDGAYQLEDDQLAGLVAAELARLKSPLTACLTLVVAVSQLFYRLYCGVAAWGNQRSGILRGLATAIAALAYGLFWLSRWPGFWGSRWRQAQGDRLALGKTGDPNGYARALVTLSAAMATARRRDPLLGLRLDGLAPLLPVSPEAALPLGILLQRPHSETEFSTTLTTLLQWPCPRRYRPWLTLNQTHPPLGERLRSLMALAQRWGLTLELPEVYRNGPEGDRPALSTQDMLLQTAPYWAPLLGASLALLLWSIGGIAGRQSVLGWLWGDRPILYGLAAMGLSMGLLARVNRYFPEAASEEVSSAADLLALRASQAVPLQGVLVVIQGRLLGRPGLLNALGQDLLLDTESGPVRVTFTSALGPLGNLFLGLPPHRLLGQQVTVTGWFRRGATAWLDASQIRAGRGSSKANHPIWITLLGLGLALWGAWTIYRGV